jgi:hypothetical protein
MLHHTDLQIGMADSQSEVLRAYGPFSAPGSRLSDADIRRALESFLEAACLSGEHQLLEEVGLWRGHVRADYIISSPGSIRVIEIKSDRDSFRRFEEQARVYSSFANRVTLVVGWALAVEALREAPWWWDVWLAERHPAGKTVIIPLRDGDENPEPLAGSLARMLPVDEVRRAAGLVDPEQRVAGMNSGDLRKLLAERMSISQLRVLVAEWLKQLALTRVADPSVRARATLTGSDLTRGVKRTEAMEPRL